MADHTSATPEQIRKAAKHARRIAWLRAREICLTLLLEQYAQGKLDRRPAGGSADWLRVSRDYSRGRLLLTAHCPDELVPGVKSLATDLEASIRRAMAITIPVAVLQVKPYWGRKVGQ